jgi:hypothetical protein
MSPVHKLFLIVAAAALVQVIRLCWIAAKEADEGTR